MSRSKPEGEALLTARSSSITACTEMWLCLEVGAIDDLQHFDGIHQAKVGRGKYLKNKKKKKKKERKKKKAEIFMSRIKNKTTTNKKQKNMGRKTAHFATTTKCRSTS